MPFPALEPITVPLRPDEFGGLRVVETRVLLELIVRAYQAGATPEEIVQAYDVLKLRDVNPVVAWCLSNEAVVQEYVTERERQASTIRDELQAIRPVNTELLKSLRAKQQYMTHIAEERRHAQVVANHEDASTGE